MNELIFIAQVFFISCATLAALYAGKHALISLICLQCVLANVFVLKEITLCGLTATGSDAFTVGIVLGLNLLQEYYGRALARTTVFLSFALLIFYIIVSAIHLHYIPACTDTMQVHYGALFGHMPRIMIASLSVYVMVQLFDTALFARLNQWFSGNYLPLRVLISLSISQLLDTILFSYLGLYGIISNVTHIIMVSYTIKLMSIVLSSPFVALSKLIKKPTLCVLILITPLIIQAEPTKPRTYRAKHQAVAAAVNKQIAYTAAASLVTLSAGLYLKNDTLRGLGIGGISGSAVFALRKSGFGILTWLASLWGQARLGDQWCTTDPASITLTEQEMALVNKHCRSLPINTDIRHLPHGSLREQILADLAIQKEEQEQIHALQEKYRHIKSRIPITASSFTACCAAYLWLRYISNRIEKEVHSPINTKAQS